MKVIVRINRCWSVFKNIYVILLCVALVQCKNNTHTHTEGNDIVVAAKEDVDNNLNIQPYIGFVNSKGGLNLRSKSNAKSKKIITLPMDAEVQVLERTGKFEEVAIGDNEKANGQWVYISYKSKKNKEELKGYIHDYFINFSFDRSIEQKSLSEIKREFHSGKFCVMDEVSEKFLYSIKTLEFNKETNQPIRVRVEIQGITEANMRFQRYDYHPEYWYHDEAASCDARNYFENQESSTIGDFGYFNVWDYNMDGLEDFAILNDVGSSAGSIYDFYLQQEDGSFSRDESFPLQGLFFPSSIDFTDKIITEAHPLGCCAISTSAYRKVEAGEWVLVSSTIEDL